MALWQKAERRITQQRAGGLRTAPDMQSGIGVAANVSQHAEKTCAGRGGVRRAVLATRLLSARSKLQTTIRTGLTHSACVRVCVCASVLYVCVCGGVVVSVGACVVCMCRLLVAHTRIKSCETGVVSLWTVKPRFH